MEIKTIFSIMVLVLCSSASAQNTYQSTQNKIKIAQNIPYEDGIKSTKIISAEIAIEKHPMLSSALNGVIEATERCVLFQFDSRERSKDDIYSTQFNGGELRVEFTYFCYNQTKIRNNGVSQVVADVVLKIEGDFSLAEKVIFDPAISYSKCYSHFCGSN